MYINADRAVLLHVILYGLDVKVKNYDLINYSGTVGEACDLISVWGGGAFLILKTGSESTPYSSPELCSF